MADIDNRKDKEEKTQNGMGRRIFSFLKGMPFSFILLGLMILGCIAGSIVPQNQPLHVYYDTYGAAKGNILLSLSLNHVFTSWWFILITGLLCFNLILCSISRIKGVVRAWKSTRRLSVWGSWVTHLGFLLLIISFTLSQITSKELELYGIPGSTQELGNSGLSVTIDSFDVELRDDFTVEQYVAGLTVTDEKGEYLSGNASVNHPFKAFKYNFYQDSTGWATYVDILKDGEVVKTDLLCAGEYTYPDDLRSLVLMFSHLYPDFDIDEDRNYYSKTPLLNNPIYLYGIYYDGSLMSIDFAAPDELIEVHNYAFRMYDPCQYTLVVAKSDPCAWLVGVSSLVLVSGLFLSFYVKPWEEKRSKENG